MKMLSSAFHSLFPPRFVRYSLSAVDGQSSSIAVLITPVTPLVRDFSIKLGLFHPASARSNAIYIDADDAISF
jgi:hypothetical protein